MRSDNGQFTDLDDYGKVIALIKELTTSADSTGDLQKLEESVKSYLAIVDKE